MKRPPLPLIHREDKNMNRLNALLSKLESISDDVRVIDP